MVFSGRSLLSSSLSLLSLVVVVVVVVVALVLLATSIVIITIITLMRTGPRTSGARADRRRQSGPGARPGHIDFYY